MRSSIGGLVKALFQSAIFLASLLLFLSEPMAAKQLLPVFGGSAAVWITCLVFFQVALLAGYLYAHLLELWSGKNSVGWIWLHGGLLAGAVACAAGWAFGGAPMAWSTGHPVLQIFVSLGASIGIPFLVLGSTSPLLQVWLGRLETGGVPFRLFGLSNLASLIALVAYPSLIEPHMALRTQRVLWFGGVLLFAIVSGALAWTVLRSPVKGAHVSDAEDGAPSTRGRRLLWFLLPMAGALQLSAVTAHLTSNVAAIPLLWILPLAAYLATFVLAFQFHRLVPRTALMGLLAVMLLSLGNFIRQPQMAVPIGMAIGLFLIEIFVACLFCHAELYRLRPRNSREATLFYLMIAAGGATGSALIGIAAPLLFRLNYDLALTFIVTAALAVAACWPEGMQRRLLWGGIAVVLLAMCFQLRTSFESKSLMATRNFYGTLRVTQSVLRDGSPIRSLMYGTIVHGSENLSPNGGRVPTTYYAEDSGIAMALRGCCQGHARNVGLIGLGAGTLAAYGREGDRMRFYEINPAVMPIARNLFSFVRESPAAIDFVEGDARASLAAEAPQSFDVLVIDAFSGDAIPLHLLTREALALYSRHLAPGGVLAFHISNRYVDLKPELAELAASAGMQARSIESAEDNSRDEDGAEWVLVTPDDVLLRTPEIAAHGQPLVRRRDVHVWTDDYSSLMPLVRW